MIYNLRLSLLTFLFCVTVSTEYWSTFGWLEWNLTWLSAFRTDGIEHFSRSSLECHLSCTPF